MDMNKEKFTKMKNLSDFLMYEKINCFVDLFNQSHASHFEYSNDGFKNEMLIKFLHILVLAKKEMQTRYQGLRRLDATALSEELFELYKHELYTLVEELNEEKSFFYSDKKEFFEIYKTFNRLQKIDILEVLKIALTRGDKYSSFIHQYVCSAVHIPANTILVTRAEYYGEVLYRNINMLCDKIFTLHSSERMHIDILSYVFSEFKNVRFLEANIYKSGITDEKYELILNITDYKKKRGGRKTHKKYEPSYIEIMRLLECLSKKGTLVSVFSARSIRRYKKTSQFRKQIERNYSPIKFQALIAKGKEDLYLLMLNPGKTDHISLKQMSVVLRSNFEGEIKFEHVEKYFYYPHIVEEITIPYKEYKNCDSWRMEKLLLSQEKEVRQLIESSIPIMRLQDVARVYRGFIPRRHAASGEIAIIDSFNLNRLGVNNIRLPKVKADAEKYIPYILNEGDLILVAYEGKIKTAVFKSEPLPCLPSHRMIAIKPGEKIRSAYLKFFLESSLGQKMLKALINGHELQESRIALLELDLPVPPLEEQEALVSKFEKGLHDYHQALSKVEKAWDEALLKMESQFIGEESKKAV